MKGIEDFDDILVDARGVEGHLSVSFDMLESVVEVLSEGALGAGLSNRASETIVHRNVLIVTAIYLRV